MFCQLEWVFAEPEPPEYVCVALTSRKAEKTYGIFRIFWGIQEYAPQNVTRKLPGNILKIKSPQDNIMGTSKN